MKKIRNGICAQCKGYNCSIGNEACGLKTSLFELAAFSNSLQFVLALFNAGFRMSASQLNFTKLISEGEDL